MEDRNFEDKPGYYSFMPAEVRYDPDLVPNAKLLFSEITALSNKTGECWASDTYFANLYGVHRNTIQNWLKQLDDKNYIKRELIYKENSKEVDKRIIKITGTYQLNNWYPTPKNIAGPTPKNIAGPTPKNCADNNTRDNITRNNIIDNSTTDTSVAIVKPSTKSYKALMNYINSLTYNEDTKDSLRMWYDTVGKGKVSIEQLQKKLRYIVEITNSNEVEIKKSIDEAALKNWLGFYYNNFKNNKQNTLITNKVNTVPQSTKQYLK